MNVHTFYQNLSRDDIVGKGLETQMAHGNVRFGSTICVAQATGIVTLFLLAQLLPLHTFVEFSKKLENFEIFKIPKTLKRPEMEYKLC